MPNKDLRRKARRTKLAKVLCFFLSRRKFFSEEKNQYSDSLRIRFPLAARRGIDSA
jgi:hypothetical protein